jgi:transcriptional antiterminator
MIKLDDLVNPEQLYSLKQISDYLRVSKVSIIRMIKDGLPCIKAPKEHYYHHFMYFVKGSDVINYLSKFNE